MPVSNYVIRRYTPPTCTLEILAQNSALSRWMGKSVLKQLRFELCFDDPRLPEEQRIAIRGTHDQLEALCTTVTNYVQELLQNSHENFWVSYSEPTESSKASHVPTQDFHDYSSVQTNTTDSFSTQMQGTEIQIQPSHNLTHNLFLGSLANQASGPVIQLSLLQLFDLATALDEYSANVLALPNINNTNSSVTGLPAWAPVAAVLVLAAGLTPVTWQYANSIRQKQQTAKKPTPASEKIALAPSPSLNLSTPSPLLTPPDSLLSQPRPPLGSSLPLLGSAVPLTPQTSPGSNLSTTSRTSPKSNFPLTSQTFPNLTLPKGSVPSLGSTLKVPGTTAQIPSSKKTPPLTLERPQISLQPNLRRNGTGLTANQKSQISLQPNLSQNGTGLTSKGGIPPLPQSGISSGNLPTTGSTDPNSKIYPPLANIPNNSSSSPANLPANPSLASQNSLVARLRGTHRNTPTEVATNTGTLFDTAQVSEARDYLKKHWQPPTELKQAIQYSLLVGVDGTIEQILPLGKASRDFIDRSGMPLIGERFVSANRNGQSVRIRAVLSPDGKVQTFPENE